MDRKTRYFICDAFRWVEYATAALIAFVIAVALSRGLNDLTGIEQRIDELLRYDDTAIYDWPTEEEFVEWLLEVEDVDYTAADIDRHRRAYRYLHSFRARLDYWIRHGIFLFSVAVGCLAVYTALGFYRRKWQLRERLERRLLYS